MDKESEWKMLFEANAKLNSPDAIAFHKQLTALQHRCDEAIKAMGYNEFAEAQAEADAELRLFSKTQAGHQPAEPVEIKPVLHYELKEIADELKDIAQDMSEYHSEYRENRRVDVSNSEDEKKHRLRENLLVATFSVALTLFFEHIHDIIEFVLKFFRSLF